MSSLVSPWTPARIKWFKAKHGFGFAYRENYPDIFIHTNMLQKAGYCGRLHIDTPIELQFIETEKGFKAVDIRVPQR